MAASLHALGPWASSHLALDRTLALQGEPWRLLSGHWVHTNTAHLLLNLSGWALLLAAHPTAWRSACRHAPLTWLWLSACTGASLAWAFPAVSPYMGLSGLLHGWWLLLAWRAVQQGERAWGWGSLALLALKLGSEMVGIAPQQSAEWIGARVAHEGHLCGAMGGLLLAMMAKRLRRRRLRA